MVAISLYRGNLQRVPDTPWRWLMPFSILFFIVVQKPSLSSPPPLNLTFTLIPTPILILTLI
ncbi:hypothetical protein RJ641_014472 [Dillenia turbinata]|uniref:Uncharacterized protein n=1 Tax=Dillenia turbinata TaxID=194707 RepID=A0AAN8UX41_9MAGN